MPQYVAFLRAINVGGRFIKMSALLAHFKTLGDAGLSIAEPRSYINSGNVMFQSKARNPPLLAQSLQAGLAPLLGFTSEVFIRSEVEVLNIVQRAQSLSALHPTAQDINIGFLSHPLDALQTSTLQALTSALDSFTADGPEMYWVCQVKQSESACSNAVLERKLKLRTTLRRATMLAGLAKTLSST
jgi:uncharacterized protein (DUF1697 family)